MSKNDQPPKLAHRFFQWYCHPGYLEDLEGDLVERFERRTSVKGLKAARWGFIKEVLQLFRPEIIKPLGGVQQLNHYGMFKNYFKITWRSLLKQKLYSIINVGGLSLGLTCAVLVFLYVQYELSFDKFYPHSDHIHRVYQKLAGSFYQGSDHYAVTHAPLATALMEEVPDIERATSVAEHTALLGLAETTYWEEGLWADVHFFDVFQLPFVKGNPATALQKSESIVLTESLAHKVFGKKDPMGQGLTFQGNTLFTVTGVIKDPPANSSLRFSYLAAMLSNHEYTTDIRKEKWDNNPVHTFFSVTQGTDLSNLQGKLTGIYEKYVDYGKDFPFQGSYHFQPLGRFHLETNLNFDIGSKGNTSYLYLFSIIAFVILLLACINYMNLAIARSIKRAREVGLRKVVGASRWQLIGQFIGESLMITFFALLLALVFTNFAIPGFAQWTECPIELDLVKNRFLLLILFVLLLGVGIVSGSYPAFFMSSLRPVHVFKGKIGKKPKGLKIQQWLIIGQYTASIVLVVSSIVIFKQFEYIQKKELGYQKEHILTIPVQGNELKKQVDLLKTEWLANPGVSAVTASLDLPTDITSAIIIHGESEEELMIYDFRVDTDFLKVFEMNMVAGRSFSEEIKSDQEEAFILNETAAKALGWSPGEAIGKQLEHNGMKTVIGVVKDFHMHSMHLTIEPLVIRMRKQHFDHISLKIDPRNLAQVLPALKASFNKYSPYPFEYKFLDEQFDLLYRTELRLGEMLGVFTLLSILIASLGLFGLAAFTASQRTKEIGIRKVLGSPVKGIVALLAKDFLKVVVIGFLMATPIAWYSMHRWLQDFAYRIQLEWWMFALAGAFAILIAFITVSSQSLKAALANPVDSLRNE
ncbi:MAG: ABC transporter permease [Cytophagales bacterium]|nr:ABC transporter permease [Cytophagales bacterium]